MLKLKAYHLQVLLLCHGLDTTNEQWVSNSSPRSNGDCVGLWTGPCPFLGLDVHVCKMGSGHGIFASLFPERQHHRWVHVGQLQKGHCGQGDGGGWEPVPFVLFKGKERAALAWCEPLDTRSYGLDSWENFFKTALLPSPKGKSWQRKPCTLTLPSVWW